MDSCGPHLGTPDYVSFLSVAAIVMVSAVLLVCVASLCYIFKNVRRYCCCVHLSCSLNS